MAHRRRSSALNMRPYPSPESETEPFYLHTLTQRVADHRDEGDQAPLFTDREERYERGGTGETLRNLSVRVKRDFERSENWTPKQQDSIISSWVNAVSSLFSSNGRNSTKSSGRTSSSDTTTESQPEDESGAADWTAPDTAASYDNAASSEGSRYDAAGDFRGYEKHKKLNEGRYSRGRAGSRGEYVRAYENRNAKAYGRSDGDDFSPPLRRQRTRNERDSTQRIYRAEYNTPIPHKNTYSGSYSAAETDFDDYGGQDFEIQRENTRRTARYKTAGRRRGDGSNGRAYVYLREDEFTRPRYDGYSGYDNRNLNSNAGRGYSRGRMAPETEGDMYYRREDQGAVDMASDGQGDEEGLGDPTSVRNNEAVIDDRNGAMTSNQNMPPLSRTETREMVQLFRRLFDTLDNTLDGPEGEQQKKAIREALPDVHVALAEAERLNMQRDLDRKAAGIGEDENVDVNVDGSTRAAEERENEASEGMRRDLQPPDSGERERDGGRDVPADADADESLRGVPPSSPAYGTRRKLLRQKSNGFMGGLYDSISSSISAML